MSLNRFNLPMKYDPLVPPDPLQWLESDEDTRIDLVRRYHRKQRIKLPHMDSHASLHVIVENQVAMGDELPVAATLQRLMGEGLDRHDAIHAIASVLTEMLWASQQPTGLQAAADPNQYYFEALKKLSKQSWYDSYVGS